MLPSRLISTGLGPAKDGEGRRAERRADEEEERKEEKHIGAGARKHATSTRSRAAGVERERGIMGIISAFCRGSVWAEALSELSGAV